jgi:hypothetical protein
MLESAQDARHAKAIQAAHAARGAMVLSLWKMVFARKTDRRLSPVVL